MLPIIAALLSFLFWKIIALIRPTKYKHVYKRNAISTTICLVFLLFPVIVNRTLELLKCTTVEETLYLASDLS